MTIELYLTVWVIGMFLFILGILMIGFHHFCDYTKKQKMVRTIAEATEDVLEDYTNALMQKVVDGTAEIIRKMTEVND